MKGKRRPFLSIVVAFTLLFSPLWQVRAEATMSYQIHRIPPIDIDISFSRNPFSQPYETAKYHADMNAACNASSTISRSTACTIWNRVSEVYFVKDVSDDERTIKRLNDAYRKLNQEIKKLQDSPPSLQDLSKKTGGAVAFLVGVDADVPRLLAFVGDDGYEWSSGSWSGVAHEDLPLMANTLFSLPLTPVGFPALFSDGLGDSNASTLGVSAIRRQNLQYILGTADQVLEGQPLQFAKEL